MIAHLFEEAGFPGGALNVVVGAGSEIGDAFVEHPIPSLISFTGSTDVGRNVGRIATGGKHIKRDKAPSTDGEWFDYHITVKGRKITIKVNGETTVEYTEPDGVEGGRKLGEGTRRPLRLLVKELSVDQRNGATGSIAVSFVLPKGGYATTVLERVCRWVDRSRSESPPAAGL